MSVFVMVYGAEIVVSAEVYKYSAPPNNAVLLMNFVPEMSRWEHRLQYTAPPNEPCPSLNKLLLIVKLTLSP
jgi:hypothetical protein